ncbi:MAG TPA: DUF4956 domain-containing protein [Pyrinomonadaceae bacterium]|nr:DUF4956 domain-containing protein [Pyrinomonadaceae bacterium]
MSRPTITLVVVFIAVLLASGLVVYFVLDRSSRSGSVQSTTNVQATPEAGASRPADDFFSQLLGSDTTEVAEEGSRAVRAVRILLRFIIAALLAALLAYGRRRNISVIKRNPYVAQTQILLAVVAAAMMMIVGDSAARAFGIFAAASLVRFRTNIRDPKETTVLLICLAVGLGAGVGRIDMAVILTLFVLLALWILEHFESAQVFRAMEVTVGTRNLDQTNLVLKRLFSKYAAGSELRQLEREDEVAGKIVYELSLGSTASTDRLTEEILAEDSANIVSLEWNQKKSTTYIYR